MSTELKQYMKQPNVVTAFKQALPKNKDAMKFINGVLFVVGTDKNGKLQNCSKKSIFQAAMKAAELRIDVDVREHGYMIPYGNEATLQIGYKYYVNKYTNSKLVKNIVCDVVYKNDVFEEIKGTENKLIHKPDYEQERTDENIKLFYAHIELTNGMKFTEVISKQEIDTKFRKNTDPWKKWYAEMGKKSAIKRMGKWVQLDDDDLQQVNMYEDQQYNEMHDAEIDLSGNEPEKQTTEKQADPEIKEAEVVDNIPESTEIEAEQEADLF